MLIAYADSYDAYGSVDVDYWYGCPLGDLGGGVALSIGSACWDSGAWDEPDCSVYDVRYAVAVDDCVAYSG